jgi:hypothetical protein
VLRSLRPAEAGNAFVAEEAGISNQDIAGNTQSGEVIEKRQGDVRRIGYLQAGRIDGAHIVKQRHVIICAEVEGNRLRCSTRRIGDSRRRAARSATQAEHERLMSKGSETACALSRDRANGAFARHDKTWRMVLGWHRALDRLP